MSDNTTPEPSEQEKLRREREWLLADIDVSPVIKAYQREQEMNALWDANRAALDRTAETLTDHAPPERPVSGEETSR